MICDQFDVLYEDGLKTGRVMSICTHPFLVGHPHLLQIFRQGAGPRHLAAGGVVATGSEIIDWYKKQTTNR